MEFTLRLHPINEIKAFSLWKSPTLKKREF